MGLLMDLMGEGKIRMLFGASALALALETAAFFSDSPPIWLAQLFFLGALVLGRHVVLEGIQALFKFRFARIQLLITIAAVGAVWLGEYLEAAVVLILFAASEALEEHGFKKSYASLEGMLQKSPKEAQVKGQGPTPISELKQGDIVEVRSGAAIPVDGEIVTGSGLVDEASITGEPLPRSRVQGDPVFAGTINVDGYFEVKADRAGADTTLARIVDMTYEAAERKLKFQTFIERFAGIYTPSVILIALALATLPFVVGWAPEPWVAKALALLVIACPCALTMATPVSVFAAVSAASARGVVVKGGRPLEDLAKVKVVAFDKTRTLTHGEPIVTDVVAFAGLKNNDVLSAAAGLEALSDHPLARAILDSAKAASATPHPMEAFQNVAGMGISGQCKVCADGHHCLGSPEFAMQEHGTINLASESVERFQQEGKTAVVLSNSGGAVGVIALEDRLRAESLTVVEDLRQLGVESVMLTGDHLRAAKKVGKRVGIKNVRASLLPADKVEAVAIIQNELGPVAMVGDGVNDAPALAASAVGIAMGAAGSDVAVENADIALMNDRLENLPFLIRLSRATVGKIRLNAWSAIAVKLSVLVLSIFGLVGLEAAILSDVGMTIVVILNGLRLLRFV